MVVFHSAHYAKKHWGNAEWSVFLGRMMSGDTNRRLVVYRLDYEQELPPFLAANLWCGGLLPFQLATELADVMGIEFNNVWYHVMNREVSRKIACPLGSDVTLSGSRGQNINRDCGRYQFGQLRQRRKYYSQCQADAQRG